MKYLSTFFFQSYEKQLSKANDKIKKLQDEKDLVKLEMGSRLVKFILVKFSQANHGKVFNCLIINIKMVHHCII